MSSSSDQMVASVQKFQARELPLKTVTVFTDRAELRRTFEVVLQEGLNDVLIENVASSIDMDSIRVDGHGSATIHEVQFKSDHNVTHAEMDTPQVKEMVKELQSLKDRSAQLEDMKNVYQKRLTSLNDLIENLGKASVKGDNASPTFKFDNSAETSLDNLYAFHEKKCIEINVKVRETAQQQEDLREVISKLEQKIHELRGGSDYVKRSISITLETKLKETTIELEVSYQVYQAHWRPTYDVRVQTSGGKPKFQLFYFGNIQQQTGEDWNDVELLLSTASPRTGGSLPELPTLRVQFSRPEPVVMHARAAPKMMMRCSAAPVPEMMMAAYDELTIQEAQVDKHVLSTTFSIPQRKTIPSDTSDHKVTIVVLELDPVLHFDCVPSKNTNVFMTATAVNTSTYPLLAGMASIYVDNSFSSKVYLKAVASGERFDCPLGVDPTVKVQYKPVHKYQQQTGMLSKASVTMNEQKIVVKNTKSEPVLLTLVEAVPKSTDEKIKVKLHQPELKNGSSPVHSSVSEDLKLPEVGAILNDNNNLQWTLLLGKAEERELAVKWAVEFPLNETVEYKEDV